MNVPYTESSGLPGLALFFRRFAGRATLRKRPAFFKRRSWMQKKKEIDEIR